jgi:hypothetical protein
MQPRTCPNCGATVNPNARFCPQCGATVAQSPREPGYATPRAQPGPGGPAAIGNPPSDTPITDAGTFFGALFDFSFSEFITTRIIKVLYILAIILSGLAGLGIFATFASQGGTAAIFGLVLAPIVFLVYVIVARVWMEIIIVIFRIAEYAREIARNSRG